ncbi:unnamed protein product [Calypogeia fissa]
MATPKVRYSLSEYDHELPSFESQQNYSDAVDIKGRPVDKSKTGTLKAAPFLYAIDLATFQATTGVPANLVPYLAGTMHRPISEAATITTNLLGTTFALSVLGGFIADSYLGAFFTLCAGGISIMLGLVLLVLSTALSKLQPAPCGPTAPCKPAGARYMAPLYVALYTIAFGAGLVKPTNVSMGGDQYDQSSPKEREQSIHFYLYFFFVNNIGVLLSLTIGVYLQDDISRSWGYGFSLMLFAVCFLIFIAGVKVYRHKSPAGSFLTRMAQVLVASFRKWKAEVPADPKELYNPALGRFKVKIGHSSKLRFLDRAAVIDEVDKNALVAGRPDPWRLCRVTQVEESKRLFQFLPVWITLAPVTLVFSQIPTFTVEQGQSLDRRLGPHFVIPPASLVLMMTIVVLICVPIYDRILLPFVKKYTKSPYGFAPLQRLGMTLVISVISLACAALVERKRLTYVRAMHLETLPLGASVLPMTFWYLLPQFFVAAQVELFFYVASYEFFYHEAAQTTRSVGSSFTYTATALGNYLSTIIVNITNHVTRHEQGGSWLKGQLNNGGLEKFYWLLAVVVGVDLVLFSVAAHFYQYKHNWYSPETSELSETEGNVVPLMQLGRVGADPQ